MWKDLKSKILSQKNQTPNWATKYLKYNALCGFWIYTHCMHAVHICNCTCCTYHIYVMRYIFLPDQKAVYEDSSAFVSFEWAPLGQFSHITFRQFPLTTPSFREEVIQNVFPHLRCSEALCISFPMKDLQIRMSQWFPLKPVGLRTFSSSECKSQADRQ